MGSKPFQDKTRCSIPVLDMMQKGGENVSKLESSQQEYVLKKPDFCCFLLGTNCFRKGNRSEFQTCRWTRVRLVRVGRNGNPPWVSSGFNLYRNKNVEYRIDWQTDRHCSFIMLLMLRFGGLILIAI